MSDPDWSGLFITLSLLAIGGLCLVIGTVKSIMNFVRRSHDRVIPPRA